MTQPESKTTEPCIAPLNDEVFIDSMRILRKGNLLLLDNKGEAMELNLTQEQNLCKLIKDWFYERY